MSYLPGQFTHIPAVSSSSNITGGVNVSDCVLNYNTLSGNKTVPQCNFFFHNRACLLGLWPKQMSFVLSFKGIS